jgi:hypothetical protein
MPRPTAVLTLLALTACAARTQAGRGEAPPRSGGPPLPRRPGSWADA